MSKILMCYFSCSETTAIYSNRLAKAIDADLFEIIPIEPYTKQDLDWQNKQSRSSIEMSNPKARVEFEKNLSSLDGYDKIVICFPIWWYTAPRIINSFLEAYNFENKSIFICATSGSSPMGRIVNTLSTTYPQYKFIEGKVLNHISDSEAEQLINLIKK